MTSTNWRTAAVGGLVLLALLGGAEAECGNACSGHGTCGAYDECDCYQNFQGNDCSERTCYSGLAHVDTPKGDLNSDGIVSGPLTTVLTGSEVYPWGTTEQYPNADANEGHFYMECSNKGLCDRKTGVCECFDGYTGTACARAACPNDCSGHGTCESIKELAAMRHYDATANHAPTSRVAGGSAHADYDGNVEESYSYDLWDQDKTMGCKCDPGYYAADCSMRKCKYGVDPLYFDASDGVIYQSTIIHLGSTGTTAGDLGGTFKIVFYDVFGEQYVTKGIDASYATGTSEKVVRALQALPNGAVFKTSTDTTAVAPDPVTVSKQSKTGTVTVNYDGGMGGGAVGDTGAGLGAPGSGDGSLPYGVEYTIRFTSNPGVLKSIGVDAQQVFNPGAADYWVADYRQGMFSTRYTTNLGRVNTMKYGSKLLYTNADLSMAAPVNTMLKIGGQEMRVTACAWWGLTMNQEYLGASILPALTDTGVQVNALATTMLTTGTCSGGNGGDNCPGQNADQATCVAAACSGGTGAGCSGAGDAKCTWAFNSGSTDQLTPTAAIATTVMADHLTSGNKLYAGGCPYVSADPDVRQGSSDVILVEQGHDCLTDQLTGGVILYRRADDLSNQNIFTTSDTAVTTQTLMAKRGSPDVYIVDNTLVDSSSLPLFAKSYAATGTKFTFEAAAAAGGVIAIDTPVFVNGLGPIKATTAVAAADTELVCSGNEPTTLFGADFAGTKYPVVKATSDTTSISAGSILELNGRRYKVKAIGAADGVSNAKITLADNFAGSALLEICSTCVTAVPADGLHITTSARVNQVYLGDKLMVGDHVHGDSAMTVTYVGTHGENSNAYLQTVQKTSAGTAFGKVAAPAGTCTGGTGTECSQHDGKGKAACVAAACTGGTGAGCSGTGDAFCTFAVAAISGVTKALFKVVNGGAHGFKGSLITESASATSFQYVAQCSNRGTCNPETGLCECYAGYSEANCGVQNMLAM